ncbi:MAG: N-acetylmuramoyl-L-alanine amidase [Defluviitaleaceae bacterium]|nr:N-acetylmuramoyl-L-alanine amidase [Defluviitaleaceae bacterium]
MKRRLSGRFIAVLAAIVAAIAAVLIVPQIVGLEDDGTTAQDVVVINIELLNIDSNHATMVYTFSYLHSRVDMARHHVVDPLNFVNLITYNPRNGFMGIHTDIPAGFNIESCEDTGDVLIHVVSLREAYGRVLVLDPGHGGADVGAPVAGAYESHIVLAISLYLYELFQQSDSGITVFMTRHRDDWVYLRDRSALANNLGDLFLSIHTNTYTDPSVAGTETLYSTPQSVQFAQIVQRHLVTELGTRDRGIIHRSDLYVLNTTDIPAVFAEIDFKTNPAALANLTSSAYQQMVAQALYHAIVEAFEVMT